MFHEQRFQRQRGGAHKRRGKATVRVVTLCKIKRVRKCQAVSLPTPCISQSGKEQAEERRGGEERRGEGHARIWMGKQGGEYKMEEGSRQGKLSPRKAESKPLPFQPHWYETHFPQHKHTWTRMESTFNSR